MKIDEARMKIRAVGAFFCNRCIRKDCADCNIHKAYQTMNDALEELKWYREQDLIRREDAIYGSKEDLYEAYEKMINSIPKAEPPVDKDTNVPDKE